MKLDRRHLLKSASGTVAASLAGGATGEALAWDPTRPFLNVTRPLTIQPVFMYRIPEKKELTSWKSWGGIQTEEAAWQEMSRIDRELAALPKPPGQSYRFLPVVAVSSPEQAFTLSAAGYAARKLGVRWVDIAKPAVSS